MENTLVSAKFELPQATHDGYDTASIGDNNLIVGRAVRFRKGHYILGRDEEDLLSITVCAYRFASAWQKWHSHRLIACIIERPGTYFPRSLDEIDDVDGGPGEWQLTAFLYLRNLKSGGDFTLTASSFGGRRAVETLVKQVRNMRYLHPGCLPIVRLDAGTFRSQTYGEIQCPKLTVIRWINSAGEPLTTLPHKEVTAPSAGAGKDLLDDKIPF
jgi:hypothetical protein